MSLKVLTIYFLLFSIPSFCFAHDSEGMSYEESKELIEVSLKNLRPENLVLKSDKNSTIKVSYQGHEVYLNQELMLKALNNIYLEMGESLTSEEHLVLEEVKESIFNFLKRKTINLAKSPFIFFHDLIKHLPENLAHLKLALPKYYYSRGPASLIVIAVTQIAWESVETAVSWAIGAGGAHAYCVVFNIALLKLVDNSKAFFDFILARGTELTTFQRVRLFTLSILRDWRDGKGTLASLRKLKKNITNETAHEILRQYGADRYTSVEGHLKPHAGYRELMTGNVLPELKKQILWDSFQFNLGLDYIDHVFQEHLSSLTEKVLDDVSGPRRQELLSRLWKVKAIQGKIIKAKQNLKLHMLLGEFDIKNPRKNSFVERYNAFFDLLEKFYKLSNTALSRQPKVFEEKFRRLNEHVSRMNNFSKVNINQFSLPSCLKLVL